MSIKLPFSETAPWSAPEVQQYRQEQAQEQARQAKRDRDSPGMSR